MLYVVGFGSTDQIEALVALALECLEPICDSEYAIAACEARSALGRCGSDDLRIYLGRQLRGSPGHRSRHKQPQRQIPRVLEANRVRRV